MVEWIQKTECQDCEQFLVALERMDTVLSLFMMLLVGEFRTFNHHHNCDTCPSQNGILV